MADAEHPDSYSLDEHFTLRHRWYPGRSLRPLAGGEIDALGDESLYAPSRLGRAGCDISTVPAGARKSFALFFEVGPDGLPAGVQVWFAMRGQSPCGDRLTASDVARGSGVELLEAESGMLGFRTTGDLAPGERVELVVGGPEGFRWTPLAGRREFKVIVDLGDGSPRRRLPEPVAIDVRPRPVDHLDVFGPGSRVAEAPVHATVRARDEFDNPVLTCGEVRTAYAPSDAEALRVTACVDDVSGISNPCVRSDDLQLYFGDLHAHDFFSAAEGYTDDVYRWAIEQKRLDFLAVPLQGHGGHENDRWTLVKYFNERFSREGEFVTFLSFEWQHSHYGDKVVHYLGGDQPYLPVDDPRYDTPAKLYAALRGSDALVIGHHPGYPLDCHVSGTDYGAVETDVEVLTEIWSMHGSSEGYDATDRPLIQISDNSAMAALRSGVRVGLLAGSDTHSGRPGGSAKEPRPYWGGLAAVWAEELTRRSLFEALRARRTYALTGARIVLRMTVNGEPMGGQLPAADRCEVQVDVWGCAPIRKIEFMKNGDPWHIERPGGDEFHGVREDVDITPGTFYHCRVTQEDGHLAVCSPVWIGSEMGTVPVSTA